MPKLRTHSLPRVVLAICLALFTASAGASCQESIGPAQTAVAQHGMVVAQESAAAQIGADILQKGGNAVDAAVAVGFALAVTYPRAGNLGGGGFMVIHRADGENAAIDYRETAPHAITSTSFLDAQGHADPEKSRNSALAVGVPGTVDGLALAEQKYGSGRFTLAELIAPAVAIARDGIEFPSAAADLTPSVLARLSHWPASAQIFLNSDGSPFKPGHRLVQTDLAGTL